MSQIQQQTSTPSPPSNSLWHLAIGLARKFYQAIGVLDPDGRPWMGRPVLATLATALAAISFWFGHYLTTRYAQLPPPDRLLLSAWRRPLELSGWRELPAFPAADIHAVAVGLDGRLWIAGAAGLLAFSDNHGIDWTLLRHENHADAFLAPGSILPPGNPTLQPASAQSPTVSRSTTASPRPQSPRTPSNGTVDQSQMPPGQKAIPPQNQPSPQLTKPSAKPRTLKKASTTAPSTRNPSHLTLASYPTSNAARLRSPDANSRVTAKEPDAVANVSSIIDTSSWSEPDLIAMGTLDNRIQVFATDGRQYEPDASGRVWMLSRSFGAGASQNPSRQSFVNRVSFPASLQASSEISRSFRKVATFEILPGQPWKLVELLPKISLDADKFLAVTKDNNRGTVEIYTGKGRIGSWTAPKGWNVDSIAAISANGPFWILARNDEKSLLASSDDQGKSITTYTFPFPLSDIVADGVGNRGYAVGQNGAIFGTADSGKHWAALTRGAARPAGGSEDFALWNVPWRLPPWWLSPFFALAVLIALPATLPVPRRNDRGIANLVISDRPLMPSDRDALNFKHIVAGLSGLLRNRDTSLPFSVAVNGKWGSGKSSLMNLLQHDLRASGLRTVWFNAWHHEDEPNLLASLLNSVRETAPPPLASIWGTFYRLRLGGLRLFRQWRAAAVFASLLLFALRAEMVMHQASPEIYVHWSKSFLDAVTITPGESAPSTAPKQEQPSTGILAQLATLSLNLACTDTPDADDCRSTKTQSKSGSASPSPEPTSNQGIHWITLLLGLMAFLPKLDEILRSFKANPAELLATVSSGKKIGDLEAQTSFRMKFARQFREVTWALGRRRLVIFIDDLDRCRPEKVAQLLESVNYIMVSGESVVVLALEERAIRANLGLNFARIAEEIEPDPSALPSTPISGPSGLLAETRQLHIDYAKQYVDKLLNLVIQIPEPTPEQLIALATQEKGVA